MRAFLRLCVFGLALTFGATNEPVSAAERITVFGAASLTDALEEAGRVYGRETGRAVRFSFAASSTLARQIEAGAPAHVLVSANERWMDYLAERDLIEIGTRVSPIANRLVLIAPEDSPLRGLEIDRSLDLATILGRDGRLALGDPEHVPAGIYAQQAMEDLGLWRTVASRLARADNVRAALALVERGEAPLGVVYATDASISKGVKVVGAFPIGSHTPISYPFAIVKGQDSAPVRDFFAFLTGDGGLAIFGRFGFVRD